MAGTALNAYSDYKKRRKKGESVLEAATRTGASVAVSAVASTFPEAIATVGSTAIPIPVVGTAIGYGVGLAAEYGVEQLNEKVVNGDIN